jgi:hypothetical protein
MSELMKFSTDPFEDAESNAKWISFRNKNVQAKASLHLEP